MRVAGRCVIMNAEMTFEDRLPVDAVRALVDRHGLWRVVRAALAAAALPGPGRKVRVMHADALSDHLRRDIRLPPQGARQVHWPPQR